MIAYQLYGEQDLRLENVDKPEVGRQDVRIRVAHNGICGSDLHFLFGKGGWRRPRYIGHEISGVVEAVGADVRDVSEGGRVCVFPIDSCGACSQCQDDHPVLCMKFDRAVSTVGCGAPIGGLAEYCAVPQRLILPLPDALSLSHGALVEPLAVAATAVLRAKIPASAAVAVLGGGPIGIGAVLALQATGVRDVFVAEPAPARQEALRLLTDARVIDPGRENVAEVVRDQTGGSGVDLALECAGVPASLDSAIESVRKGGKIVLVGLFEMTYEMLPNTVAMNEVTIVGHNGSTKSGFESVINWMTEGKVPIDGWVDHVPFARAIPDGFEPLRRGERVKVLVDVAP